MSGWWECGCLGNTEFGMGLYIPFPIKKAKEVTYWPHTEVLAVPCPGAQLFNLSGRLGEACGNLAVHKQGNNLPPILEFIHCCCYEGFRLQSHSVGSQQSRVCC